MNQGASQHRICQRVRVYGGLDVWEQIVFSSLPHAHTPALGLWAVTETADEYGEPNTEH